MSKEREKTFSESFDEFDPQKLHQEQQRIHLDSWRKTIVKGIIYGVLVYILNILFLLFLNILQFGGFLEIFDQLLLLEAGVFFMSSTFHIYFGPSPSWARLKAEIFNESIKPPNQSLSLRKGAIRFLIGVTLVFLS